MNSGIYALVNKKNGKRYIGQTNNFTKRKQMHFWELRSNRHHNAHLQRAWNKGDRFSFEIVEECEPDKCNEREIFWIAFYDCMNDKKGYNLCQGGGTTTGYHFTDEAKAKISKANSGRKWSQEAIDRRTAGLKKHLEEDPEFAKSFKEKCRESCIKRSFGGWNRGKHLSEEHKRKISENQKGKYVSLETREKLRQRFDGEKSITAKLKTSDVVKMRYRFLCGEKRMDIAKDYPQMSPQTIYDVVVGKRWKSVSMDKSELEKMLKEA